MNDLTVDPFKHSRTILPEFSSAASTEEDFSCFLKGNVFV